MLQLSFFESIADAPASAPASAPELPPVVIWRNFLTHTEADDLFYLSINADWQQNQITMYGKTIALPRLEAIYGDCYCNYKYSGVTLEALPWLDWLLRIRARIELQTGYAYHLAIGNRYADGSQYIGWHSDDSKEMGKEPAIASLSLGDTRRFMVRRKDSKQTWEYELTHGSLLLMQPGCQERFAHQLPKTARAVGERINWTFRPHVNGIKNAADAK